MSTFFILTPLTYKCFSRTFLFFKNIEVMTPKQVVPFIQDRGPFWFSHIFNEILQYIEIWNEFKVWNHCVQIFRKIIQLNAVIILKSTNKYYRKIISKSSRKMDLYPAMECIYRTYLKCISCAFRNVELRAVEFLIHGYLLLFILHPGRIKCLIISLRNDQ